MKRILIVLNVVFYLATMGCGENPVGPYTHWFVVDSKGKSLIGPFDTLNACLYFVDYYPGKNKCKRFD